MKRMEAEYVDRFDRLDSIESVRRARERLARGTPMLFFAEGTTSHTPGLLPFHMGAFVTSAKTGVPLVPVAISGTRSILRSDSWFPRRGQVRVVIGDVILPDQQMETWKAAKQLREACRNFILAHSGEQVSAMNARLLETT